MRRLTWLCIVGLICSAHAVALQEAQYSTQAESRFRKGLELFTQGDYRGASGAFSDIIQLYPESHRITAAFVMKAKALYEIQENLETAKTIRTFLSRYPGSSYLPDAHVILGSVYLRIGRAEEASTEFFDALEGLNGNSPPRLRQEIVAALDTVMNSGMSVSALRDLASKSSHFEGRAYLWLKIAEKEMAAGNGQLAANALDSLTRNYRTSAFAARGTLLRERLGRRSAVRIGILLPLMKNAPPSALRDPGNEVLDGIQFAFDEYSQTGSNRIQISLDIRDTDREPSVAIRQARALADDKEVVGIIGPVFSTTTSAVVPVANALRIPLITPTANANGLASGGPYTFQANPDYTTRGKAMARYAVLTKGWNVLAVLAPSDTYGKFLADGFVKEALRLGAKIVANESYQKGATDLKTQLAAIRRAGIKAGADPLISFAGKMRQASLMKLIDAGVSPVRLDSLMARNASVSATWLLGENGAAKAEALGFKITFDESRVDSTQYPVNAIQACYLPISSPEEIGVMVSQIVYFNFHTQILGSGEWDNFEQLDANKRYAGGVIFESDTYIDSSSTAYREFLRGFRARFKRNPTHNTMYGYDTARMLFSLVEKGATTREELSRALAEVKDFPGLHSHIGFSAGRVNSWLHFMQYDQDSIRKIGEIHVDP